MLRKEGDYKSSYYYQEIARSFTNEDDQQSFALRLVIHYVGDIHQPLHATAAVDAEYPSGDRGGNSEYVSPVVDGVKNLHSIWDSVMYNYCGYPDLPISDKDWDFYTSEVDNMVEKYPVNPKIIENLNF